MEFHAGRVLAGPPLPEKADARIRTADPFITSEVLYQLSYVGAPAVYRRHPRGENGCVAGVMEC
jgi:hypothetical protein